MAGLSEPARPERFTMPTKVSSSLCSVHGPRLAHCVYIICHRCTHIWFIVKCTHFTSSLYATEPSTLRSRIVLWLVAYISVRCSQCLEFQYVILEELMFV